VLLEAKNLTKNFKHPKVLALKGVSFSIEKGKTLGVVGESGSGKSTLAKLVTRLLPLDEGEIYFEGQRIDSLQEAALKNFRKRAQIIFQEPFLSLDPRLKVSAILEEPFLIHRPAPGTAIFEKIKGLLETVGLSSNFLGRYPRELSGGECQRVAIARALAVEPELIVCDEILSSLDAIAQAQIVNLLLGLQKERGVSYLFISHDLRWVRHMSDGILEI
jgi:ABC-type glutathione transport system ATPase component